ncbi:MAG TPA: helix-turn-helix domain-containing protein, partial [Thermoplasmata archaeon]|nr:helix-turn-helix domain-containing protein [Thermoplasmata archaeon]
MGVPIDSGIAALFGSATRARTLAVLANSLEPLTGYRIAEVSGDERIKVYSMLASLERAGIVVSTKREDGRTTVWTLRDPDVGSLLRRRVRLVGEKEWDTDVTKRLSEVRDLR